MAQLQQHVVNSNHRLIGKHVSPAPASKVCEIARAPVHAYKGNNQSDVTAPLTFIGGDGGKQVSIRAWESGKLITRLRVYSGYSCIKAMKVWLTGDEYSEGTCLGEPDGTDYKEYTFSEGERITHMSLLGNGNGTRAGWIFFRTNKGGVFSYGMHGWPLRTEYPVNVGSGILAGAIYNAGCDIDAHGYYFLSSSVTSSKLENVKYPTLKFDTSGITPVSLDTYKQTNTSSSPRNWSFGGKRTVKSTTKWGLKIANTFNVELSVEAGVPQVSKSGAKFGWTISVASDHEESEERTQELVWSTGGTLQPGETVDLVALTRQGNLNDLRFEGTMVVTLKNGASFRFPLSGPYKGICYTGVEIKDHEETKTMAMKSYASLCL